MLDFNHKMALYAVLWFTAQLVYRNVNGCINYYRTRIYNQKILILQLPSTNNTLALNLLLF